MSDDFVEVGQKSGAQRHKDEGKPSVFWNIYLKPGKTFFTEL
jgi:hypothetical protein